MGGLGILADLLLYRQQSAIPDSPRPDYITVPPGGRLIFPPEPVQGTPEENPLLTLHFRIVDHQTSSSVVASVVMLDDKVLYRNCSEFALTLPGDLSKRYVSLKVNANGYEPWEISLRHRIKHSRILRYNIRMERARGPSAYSGHPFMMALVIQK